MNKLILSLLLSLVFVGRLAAEERMVAHTTAPVATSDLSGILVASAPITMLYVKITSAATSLEARLEFYDTEVSTNDANAIKPISDIDATSLQDLTYTNSSFETIFSSGMFYNKIGEFGFTFAVAPAAGMPRGRKILP